MAGMTSEAIASPATPKIAMPAAVVRPIAARTPRIGPAQHAAHAAAPTPIIAALSRLPLEFSDGVRAQLVALFLDPELERRKMSRADVQQFAAILSPGGGVRVLLDDEVQWVAQLRSKRAVEALTVPRGTP